MRDGAPLFGFFGVVESQVAHSGERNPWSHRKAPNSRRWYGSTIPVCFSIIGLLIRQRRQTWPRVGLQKASLASRDPGVALAAPAIQLAAPFPASSHAASEARFSACSD